MVNFEAVFTNEWAAFCVARGEPMLHYVAHTIVVEMADEDWGGVFLSPECTHCHAVIQRDTFNAVLGVRIQSPERRHLGDAGTIHYSCLNRFPIVGPL